MTFIPQHRWLSLAVIGLLAMVVTASGNRASPIIQVTPNAINDTLPSGNVSTHTLTIENGGDSDLLWALAIGDLSGSPLAGMRLLSPKQYDGVLENSIVAQALVDSGVTVENERVMFDPGTLQNYDLLWVRDPTNEVPGGTWPQWALDEVRNWLLAGGRALISTDNADQIASMNTLFNDAGINIVMGTRSPFFGPTTELTLHPITIDVDSLFLLDSAGLISAIASPAGELARYPNSSVVAGHSGVGLGRLVAIGSQPDLGAATWPDNLIFMVQAFRWLALPSPGWLSASPTSGSVPAGQLADVDVGIETFGLLAGQYTADLRIASNDPVIPEVVVPVHLVVTGDPDITVSNPILDFGTVFIHITADLPLVVYNNGTDALHVSDVSSDNPFFDASPSSFTLAPADSLTLSVTFRPDMVGPQSGTLTISSDDPLQPLLSVALQGSGDDSNAKIAVSDTLLFFGSVVVGDSNNDTLVVSNVGLLDPLVVGGIFTDSPDFAVDTTGFSLAVGQERHVVVTFRPTSDGQTSGTLTIYSSDPDSPAVTVILVGLGILPPTAWVVPDSIGDTLAVGESAVHTIAITNLGEVDLTVRLRPQGAASGFVENFEDGNHDGWILQNDPAIIEVTDETAADGTTYSLLVSDTGSGANDSSIRSFGPIQADEIVFWVRIESPVSLVGYTVFRDETRAPMIFFRTDGLEFYCNGTVAFQYTSLTWHRVECLDIDYVNQNFDYYVDGDLIQENLGFHSPVQISHVSQVEIWNLIRFRDVWWDEIAVTELAPWVSTSSSFLVVEPDSTIGVTLILDATDLSPGAYLASLLIETNDPVAGVIELPVNLQVLDEVVGIGDAATAAPTVYRLHQNHPNPFNPTTTIRYELPQPSQVRLAVYDVAGRLVQVLVHGMLPAGRHQARWDGMNTSGGAVASGVYFYRVSAGNFVQTRKMIFLK